MLTTKIEMRRLHICSPYLTQSLKLGQNFVYLDHAITSTSDCAVWYNSSLLPMFNLLCVIAGSSSNNLPNCFPWKKNRIQIKKIQFPYTVIILDIFFHEIRTSFPPNWVKKRSSKLRLASRTWQWTTDFGMECRKVPTTIWI